MKKTVGLIGGMGPLAANLMFSYIIEQTEVHRDQDHIPLLIDNNINIPDRTSYILDRTKEDPRPELIKSAKRLEALGADFLIMSCNTAYYFYEDIVGEINIPFINMIEETVKSLDEMGIKKFGLLATEGTVKARVYHRIAEKYGMEVVSPREDLQKHITEMIYNIKEDKEQKDLEGFYKTRDYLLGQGAEILVAGCTEMSVALKLYDLENIIDPMIIIARESILRSGGLLKEI